MTRNFKVPKHMGDKKCQRCDKSLQLDAITPPIEERRSDTQRRLGNVRVIKRNGKGVFVRKYCISCAKIIRRKYMRNRMRVKNPKKGLTKCFTCKGSMSYSKTKFCCAKCRRDAYVLVRLQKSIDSKTKFLKRQKLRRQVILDHYRNVQRLVV